MTLHVLVAEDNADLAHMIGLMVGVWPDVEIDVHMADFGRLLAPEPWEGIDVALLDYHLSEPITGLEIALYLKEHHPHIKRVLLTAMVMAYRKELVEAVDCYLTKPINPDQLANALGVGGTDSD